MNVFLAELHYHYEGDETISIHRSEETAFQACLSRAKTMNCLKENSDPTNISELNSSLCYGSMSFSVAEFDLED